jgi:hypothetical protein
MMTILKSVRSRKFLAALSALVSVAAMLMGARIASADEVWFQSYQRGSASEACVAQQGETPWQDSWGTNPGWSPSWEQWANNGQGGWVCSRSITWARDSAARIYNLGDIGPGGGLVFLISGGKTYEMAPKNWGVSGAIDPWEVWCDVDSDIEGAMGLGVGTGSANTTAMQPTACTTGAGVSARAYRGGGYSDWFLPSQDELNAMCNYSRNTSSPHTSPCTGAQDFVFAGSDYGFASDEYWSSSQVDVGSAWAQVLVDVFTAWVDIKAVAVRVRPVRAF